MPSFGAGSTSLRVLCALCLLAAACASPVRTVRVDRTEAHRDLTRSVITTGEPSWRSRDALIERGLSDDFEKDPEAALAELHRIMVREQGAPDLLFALAELSYLHGEDAPETMEEVRRILRLHADLAKGVATSEGE